jgi:hypothetical protein
MMTIILEVGGIQYLSALSNMANWEIALFMEVSSWEIIEINQGFSGFFHV